MKSCPKSVRTLLAAFAAMGAIATISSGQSVTTAPVGAISVGINANSEVKLGATLQRPALYAGAVSSVSSAVITIASTLPSLGTEVKYVTFTSGQARGQWFQLSANTTNTLTVSESLSSYGVVAGDKFEVRPFWTLSTLFPSGGGLPVSADPFNPSSLVLTYNAASQGSNIAANKSYLYYDDPASNDADGWYDNGSLEPAGNAIISPDTFFTARNLTASSAKAVYVGTVPVVPVATDVVSRASIIQDNLVYNPYPSALTLDNSGLLGSQSIRASDDPFSPIDILFLYPSGSTSLNSAPTASYFYYAGTPGQGDAGWYSNGSLEPSGSVQIPAGGAVLVRKASGSASVVAWTPALPYTL